MGQFAITGLALVLSLGCGPRPESGPVKQKQEPHQLRLAQSEVFQLASSRASDRPKGGVPVVLRKTGISVDRDPIVDISCKNTSGKDCSPQERAAGGARLEVDGIFKLDAFNPVWPGGPGGKGMIVAVTKKITAAAQRGMEYAIVLSDREIPYRVLAEVVHSIARGGIGDLGFVTFRAGTDGELVVLNISVPSETSKTKGSSSTKLTVRIDPKNGFEWICDACSKAHMGLLSTIPRSSDGSYPFHQLYNRLRQIRSAMPQQKHLRLGATVDVPWKTIVKSIEAAKVRLQADSYPTADAYRAAKPHADRDGFDIVFVVGPKDKLIPLRKR